MNMLEKEGYTFQLTTVSDLLKDSCEKFTVKSVTNRGVDKFKFEFIVKNSNSKIEYLDELFTISSLENDSSITEKLFEIIRLLNSRLSKSFGIQSELRSFAELNIPTYISKRRPYIARFEENEFFTF